MTTLLGDLREDQAWMAEARCHGRIQWFFAPPGERQRDRRAREYVARHICEQCPAQPECREFARANGEWGFWGGESEHERIAAGFPPTLSIRRGRRGEGAAPATPASSSATSSDLSTAC